MSIAVKPTEPLKIVKPPRAYPEWLKARLIDENAPIPESELKKLKGKIKPWMTQTATPGKISGAEIHVPAKYVPPPKNFTQKSKVKVLFKVLNLGDRPIYGYSIRANEADLKTNEKGEASIWVYPDHNFSMSTGRESGWCTPHGSNRRKRMVGMVALDAIFPIKKPTVIFLYPESGQYRVNGTTHSQIITYHNS